MHTSDITISTGLRKLDEVLAGGLMRGGITMLQHYEPRALMPALGEQMVADYLARDHEAKALVLIDTFAEQDILLSKLRILRLMLGSRDIVSVSRSHDDATDETLAYWWGWLTARLYIGVLRGSPDEASMPMHLQKAAAQIGKVGLALIISDFSTECDAPAHADMLRALVQQQGAAGLLVGCKELAPACDAVLRVQEYTAEPIHHEFALVLQKHRHAAAGVVTMVGMEFSEEERFLRFGCRYGS